MLRRSTSARFLFNRPEISLPKVPLPEGSLSSDIYTACLAKGSLEPLFFLKVPVDVFQCYILEIQSLANISWLSTLVAASICLKLLTFPVTVMVQKGARSRLESSKEATKLTNLLKEAKTFEKRNQAEQDRKDYLKKYGKFPQFRGLGWSFGVQIPLFMVTYQGFMNMARNPEMYRGFALEQPLWFDSLALADPYMITPALVTLATLTNVEINQRNPLKPQAELQEKVTYWVPRGVGLLFLPILATCPAGLTTYLAINGLMNIATTKFLTTPQAVKYFDLPPLQERAAKLDEQLIRQKLRKIG